MVYCASMPDNTTRKAAPVKPILVRLPYDVARKTEIVAHFNYLDPVNWIAQVIEKELKSHDVEEMDRALRQRKGFDKQWNSKQ